MPLGGLGPLPPVYRDKNGKLIINMTVGDPDDIKKIETRGKVSASPEGPGAPTKSKVTLPRTNVHGQMLKSDGTSRTESINAAPNLRAYFASMAQMKGGVLLTGNMRTLNLPAPMLNSVSGTRTTNVPEASSPATSMQQMGSLTAPGTLSAHTTSRLMANHIGGR